MEEKNVTLTLNEQELGVVWQTLMSGTVSGQNAPILVSVMGKIHEAVNGINNPMPMPTPEEATIEAPKEEAKSEESMAEESKVVEK